MDTCFKGPKIVRPFNIWMQTPWTRSPSVSQWSCAFPRADTYFRYFKTCHLFKVFFCRISIKSGKQQFYRQPNIEILFKTMHRTKQATNLVACRQMNYNYEQEHWVTNCGLVKNIISLIQKIIRKKLVTWVMAITFICPAPKAWFLKVVCSNLPIGNVVCSEKIIGNKCFLSYPYPYHAPVNPTNLVAG